MVKYRCRYSFILCFIFLLTFLTSHLPLGSSPILQEAIADHIEFEVEKFEENLTIQPNTLRAIDINLQKAEKTEVVFTLQVKEGLPVDVWFLNEDHYLLLINGAQFLFYIDGSEQEVIYTRKIVTLTEHDTYKLVIANYNNQTVEANVIYEIRTYFAETSSEDLPIVFYPLLLAIVILVALVIVLLFKTRNYKQTSSNISKASVKKGEKHKPKKAKPKVSEKVTIKKTETLRPKYVVPKASADESDEKTETVVSEQKESIVSEKVTPKFCGHCGKPVTTSFCTYCGRKVEITWASIE